MVLIRHRPAAPLDRYVEYFWWSRRDTPQLFHEHMLPSGSAQLVFALHDSPIICRAGTSSGASVEWSRGVVHGPQWRYYIAGHKPCGIVVGVSFKPGAAGAILGVPVTEVTDRHIRIDELWGTRGTSLQEELRQEDEPTAVFQLLERRLIERLTRPLLIHPAVAHALDSLNSARLLCRITDIQRESGYSARHFIALFHSAVGLTPQHFSRVQRFTTVLKQLAANSKTDLAATAALAGYSDQAHMSRDFRDFAGITPTQYRPAGDDRIFHHVQGQKTSIRPPIEGPRIQPDNRHRSGREV